VAGISAVGLVKRYGDITALAGVDLHVSPGEVVALLGPNGGGKSTLLRILGTTVLPDEGNASVAGHDVVSEPLAARRGLGLMVGDERACYWRLSGRRNLAFFAALHGLRGRSAREEIDRLLDRVALADVADRRVAGYSSGMRMRLLLARALLGSPRVLLLDEPTNRLDPEAAVTFRRLLEQSSAESDMAVLFATHGVREAAEIADRAVVLRGGRFVAELTAPDADDLERQLIGAVEA
jgi:ABC-2 type transport system ATP-binding protein